MLAPVDAAADAAPGNEVEGPDAPEDLRVDGEPAAGSSDEAPVDEAPPDGGGGVTLASVIGLLLALVGLRIGLTPLHDNSFFTHLATGRWILDHGAIPRSDIYSFTAPGAEWTVQSWGASVLYAAVDGAFGFPGIRVIVAACCTALAVLVWRLTSTAGGLLGRLLVAVPVLAVGSGFWVERPLIFSLLFLMAVLFALEDRLDPRWLVPILWLWVNVHGSFPIAFVAIVAYGLGRLLDRQRPTTEGRVLGWAALGTVLGGLLSPLGYHLLVFPMQLLERREAFSHIAEWKPPEWAEVSEQSFAVQLGIALVLVLAVGRNRRWRNIVPVLVLGAMSLQASRNIVHASLILVPAMAAAAQGLGAIDGLQPKRSLRLVRNVLLALGVLIAVGGIRYAPNMDLQDYPVAEAEWMRDHGLLDREDRVVTRDFVGNYFELRYGPSRVRTFFDDRVDMYPTELIDQYAELIASDGDYAGVLADHRATAVLWDTDSAFGDWLEDPDNGWEVVKRTDKWIVAVPAGGDPDR